MGAEQSTQAGAQAPDEGDVQQTDSPPTYPSALVITGPSGVGKGTLIRKLMELDGQHYGFCCSHTTRGPRPGEKVRMVLLMRICSPTVNMPVNHYGVNAGR